MRVRVPALIAGRAGAVGAWTCPWARVGGSSMGRWLMLTLRTVGAWDVQVAILENNGEMCSRAVSGTGDAGMKCWDHCWHDPFGGWVVVYSLSVTCAYSLSSGAACRVLLCT